MKKLATLLVLLPCCGLPVSAQELTLFEPVETGPAEAPGVQPQIVMNQNGQPAFTVRGTSRMGGVFKAILADRAGKNIEVTWNPGETVIIPGYQGYSVIGMESRSVSLLLPAADPCVASTAAGVSCTDPGTALLTISTAAPLPPTVQQASPVQLAGPNGAGMDPNNPPQNPFEAAIQAQAAQQGVPVPVPGGGQGFFVNPFNGEAQVVDQQSPEAQVARDARQRARSERLSRFEAVRIPADQVPAGMRVVTTPFGDRLIPIRE